MVPGTRKPAGAALAARGGFAHLSFGGSSEVGTLVSEAATPNHIPVVLQMGGKSPDVVFPAADLERAAPSSSPRSSRRPARLVRRDRGYRSHGACCGGRRADRSVPGLADRLRAQRARARSLPLISTTQRSRHRQGPGRWVGATRARRPRLLLQRHLVLFSGELPVARASICQPGLPHIHRANVPVLLYPSPQRQHGFSPALQRSAPDHQPHNPTDGPLVRSNFRSSGSGDPIAPPHVASYGILQGGSPGGPATELDILSKVINSLQSGPTNGPPCLQTIVVVP